MADLGDIRHRLCGTTLLDPGGCEVCEPVKGDLVVEEADALDILSTARKAARLLTVVMSRIELQLKKSGAKDYEKHWAKDASTVASALSRVVGEVRKFEADQSMLADGLSDAEKLDIMVHWVKGLTVDQKTQVLMKIQDALGDQRLLIG